MLFFAWSFIQSAVNYARRQRLIAILQKHLSAPFSYETGIICRRIPKITSFPGPSTSTSSSTFLIKAPSEPFLNYETSDTVILYRTEESEIVAVPKPDSLKIHEWTLFTTENIPRKSIFIPPNVPRVSFIAVIIPSPNFNNKTDGFTSTSTETLTEGLNDTDNDENGDNLLNIDAIETLDAINETDTGLLSSLLSLYANQIAFRRRKPNEILYETDLNNFFNIIFQWSESALYEFNGKGIVKEIHSVQLPNLTSERALLTLSPSNSTFSQISSNTLPATFSSSPYKQQQPYTLLEYLYFKDLFGEEFPTSWRTINVKNNYYFHNSVLKNGYSFYRSDSALNRAISPTASFYRKAVFPSSGECAITNLPTHLPPLPQPRSPSPSIPAYIRQLREHEKFDRRRTVSLNSSK
uniref:Uncharacterized protein n=1 Tax=Panagrolaimus superbus TaxID=310955 RepID=A0A914Z1Q0_9BILA